MDQCRSFVIATILVLLLATVITSSPVIAQEAEDEREFDYVQGSEKGPEHWGEIKEEWRACKSGEMQSPVDLSSKRVKAMPKSMGDISTSYRPTNATLKNRGHDIMVTGICLPSIPSTEEGNCRFDYNISRTKLEGSRKRPYPCHSAWYDLELHMVHVSPDQKVKKKIVVVGLVYKAGHRPNAFLSKLMGNVASMVDKEEEREMGVIDLRAIEMKGDEYMRYIGSLTAPPCTQGVTWFINNKISTVSRGQVRLLREAVRDYAEENARPVQKLNGRDVHLYHFEH